MNSKVLFVSIENHVALYKYVKLKKQFQGVFNLFLLTKNATLSRSKVISIFKSFSHET